MRHSLLIIGIVCLVISIIGLSRRAPTDILKTYSPCGFDQQEALKDFEHISLSCWKVRSGGWEMQPVLVARGQVYMFPTPQGYADKLKELKAIQINWRRDTTNEPYHDLDNWIQKFEDAQREFK